MGSRIGTRNSRLPTQEAQKGSVRERMFRRQLGSKSRRLRNLVGQAGPWDRNAHLEGLLLFLRKLGPTHGLRGRSDVGSVAANAYSRESRHPEYATSWTA